uniref:DNA damage-regulated autophagy modulator protein 1 n=1 Tax=Rhabditophanes sp. KR3021 TaxID=114890 RepID=A0AC35U4Y7_9BILA
MTYMMKFVWLLPIIHVIFAMTSFFSGYIIIVAKNLTDPILPYISDGGAAAPQSGIFGQFLNMAAVILGIVVHIRHMQLRVFYNYNGDRPPWNKLNDVLLVIGYITAFGMSLVANFQEFTIPIGHFFGAMGAFFCGLIYIWGQIVISLMKKPRLAPQWLIYVRIGIAILSTLSLILHLLTQWTMLFVEKDANGAMPKYTRPTHIERYTSDSPFYVRHLITTSAEWLLVLSMEVQFLTYSWDLKNFSLKWLELEYLGELVEGGRIDIRTNKFKDHKDIMNPSTISSFPRIRNNPFANIAFTGETTEDYPTPNSDTLHF